MDDVFRLVNEELVHGKPCTRARGEAVIVAQQHASSLKTGIKKLDRIHCGLIKVNIHMHEAETAIGNFRKPPRNPPAQNTYVTERRQVRPTHFLAHCKSAGSPISTIFRPGRRKSFK